MKSWSITFLPLCQKRVVYLVNLNQEHKCLSLEFLPLVMRIVKPSSLPIPSQPEWCLCSMAALDQGWQMVHNLHYRVWKANQTRIAVKRSTLNPTIKNKIINFQGINLTDILSSWGFSRLTWEEHLRVRAESLFAVIIISCLNYSPADNEPGCWSPTGLWVSKETQTWGRHKNSKHSLLLRSTYVAHCLHNHHILFLWGQIRWMEIVWDPESTPVIFWSVNKPLPVRLLLFSK